MRWVTVSVVISIVVVMVGCGAGPTPQPSAPVAEQAPDDVARVADPAPEELVGPLFVATTLEGRPVAEGVDSSIRFEVEGRVVGNAGCNSFQGTYHLDESSIAFGPLATTRMMCPPAVMDQEAAFLQALERVRGIAWDDDGALLLRPDGGEPSRFVPVAEDGESTE